MTHVKLKNVVAIATLAGHNHRNHFDNLGLKEVIFPCELAVTDPEKPEVVDDRTVLYNLVFGPDANDESKKAFLKLLKNNEPALWGMAVNMLDEGQLAPVTLVPNGDGTFAVQDGNRRYLAKTLAMLMMPDAKHADEIRFELSQSEPGKELSAAVSANAHRKQLNPVETGKAAKDLHDLNFGYKDIAQKLGIFSKPKKGQAPQPNVQYVRNCALLYDDKISDVERQAVIDGTKGYTKLLIQKGLIKAQEANAGAGEQETEDGRPAKARRRSKTLSELTAIVTSRKECEKIVAKLVEKEISDPLEVVRFVLFKAMGTKYSVLKEEVVETTEDEAAA